MPGAGRDISVKPFKAVLETCFSLWAEFRYVQASQSGGGFGFWPDPHSPRVNRLRAIFKVKLIHCRLFCVKRSYNLRNSFDLTSAPQLSAEQRLDTGLA